MKIAIYHNLEKGGALNLLINTIKILKKKNTIDIYCHKNLLNKNIASNIYIYQLKKTSNAFNQLFQVVVELKRINKQIAYTINNKHYDVVLVYQCQLTQSPYLLKYLNKNIKYIYFLNETKREFYEITSFDHYSIKRIIARMIRMPIKWIDRNNCKYSKTIITSSIVSKFKISKIYKKESFVIYPGLQHIKPQIIQKYNNRGFISIGIFLKIKGHTFSIDQLSNIQDKFTIIGRSSNEYCNIKKYSINKNIYIDQINTEDDNLKLHILKKHTFYLANNENEPYGITTLEATNNELFILGKNEGGTSEIIQSGLNGFLYPNNQNTARKVVKAMLGLKYINLHKTCKINWNNYVKKVNIIINTPYD
jgi:glycosyltransferase involved in cell wall biosynthesis